MSHMNAYFFFKCWPCRVTPCIFCSKDIKTFLEVTETCHQASSMIYTSQTTSRGHFQNYMSKLSRKLALVAYKIISCADILDFVRML